MTSVLRNLAAMALCLAVALAGVGMALTHGQMRDAAGSIVICSGDGVVTVVLDAEGNPTGPAHACPDCALCSAIAAASGTGAAPPLSIEHRLGFAVRSGTRPGPALSGNRARGPPAA